MIDGLNVARHEGFTDDAPAGCGSAAALRAAIDYFNGHNWRVIAIVPRWAMDGAEPRAIVDSGSGRRKPKCRLHRCELLQPYIKNTLHLSPSGTDDDIYILKVPRAQHHTRARTELAPPPARHVAAHGAPRHVADR